MSEVLKLIIYVVTIVGIVEGVGYYLYQDEKKCEAIKQEDKIIR